jgi:hypothetical protein
MAKKQSRPTLREFLDGAILEYRGYKNQLLRCAYQFGVGVTVQSLRGHKLCTAAVTDDISAKRLYWNLTRG